MVLSVVCLPPLTSNQHLISIPPYKAWSRHYLSSDVSLDLFLQQLQADDLAAEPSRILEHWPLPSDLSFRLPVSPLAN